MRVLLDTNVLISAFITRGLSADVFRMILGEHRLLSSTEILREFGRILSTKIKIPDSQLNSIITFLRSFEIITNIETPVKIEIRDPSDIHVIAAALNGNADMVVSGDQDLLEISEIYGVRIVDPKAFIEITRGKRK